MGDMAKDLSWLLIGLAAVVGAAGLTATGDLPPAVFTGVVMTVVTAIFGERRVSSNDKSWAEFYEAERKRWEKERAE